MRPRPITFPGQQIVKVFQDELAAMLGKPAPLVAGSPLRILLCGLQGSGKTTTDAKMARWIKDRKGLFPLLVPADTSRPAAREQLMILGQKAAIPTVDTRDMDDPEAIAKRALREASIKGYQVLIFDTAGRLHVDDELMAQLERLKAILKPKQILFVATTTNDKVFSIDLTTNVVNLFASQATMDMATGMPSGSAFNSPDNLAIDADGNIYGVEDQPGGFEDTWFALDDDNDGVAEAIGKWASLTTIGAEATGLYFDPFNPHIAYINVQHPQSGKDRTIMLLAPPVESDQGKHLGTK